MRLQPKLLSKFLCDIARAFLQSLEFLTILPLSRLYKRKAIHKPAQDFQASLSTTSLSSASSHFFWLERHGWSASLCGLFVGSICSLSAILFSFVLPNFLCACLTLCCAMILSGALHEDGLADATDALGVIKERRVSVMESSEIGSFAVLALILSFSIRAACLTFLLGESLQSLVVGLLLLHSGARSSFSLWFRYAGSMPAARLARAISRPSRFSAFSGLFICSVFSFIFLPFFVSVIFLLVFIVCSVSLLLFFVRFFKGVSGDLCGFGEQIMECVLLLALCAIMLD